MDVIERTIPEAKKVGCLNNEKKLNQYFVNISICEPWASQITLLSLEFFPIL